MRSFSKVTIPANPGAVAPKKPQVSHRTCQVLQCPRQPKAPQPELNPEFMEVNSSWFSPCPVASPSRNHLGIGTHVHPSSSLSLSSSRLKQTFLDAHLRNFLLDKGGPFPSGGIQNNPRGHRGSEAPPGSRAPVPTPSHPRC